MLLVTAMSAEHKGKALASCRDAWQGVPKSIQAGQPAMHYSFEPFEPAHLPGVKEVYNHFAASGFAHFSEEPAEDAVFAYVLHVMRRGYPAYCLFVERGLPAVHSDQAMSAARHVGGYGFVTPYGNTRAFECAGMVSLFLLPTHQRQGFGGRLLRLLEKESRQKGIGTILASIVAQNAPSLQFFAAKGYVQVGRFMAVASKFGTSLDQVWVQKML